MGEFFPITKKHLRENQEYKKPGSQRVALWLTYFSKFMLLTFQKLVQKFLSFLLTLLYFTGQSPESVNTKQAPSFT